MKGVNPIGQRDAISHFLLVPITSCTGLSSMNNATRDTTEAGIWERLIHPHGKMTSAVARHIVQLGFTDEERTRMHELVEKNQSGSMSPEEASELDNYCHVGSMLSMLQSRARQVIKLRRRVS